MKVEKEIEIRADAHSVYRFVMDPERLGEWVSIHEGLERWPGGELATGSRLTQRVRVAGRPFTVRWTVTDDHCPRRVVWKGQGPARTEARVEYRFEPDGAGTRFHYVNEYQLPGGAAGRLAGRAVAAVAGRELERSLERLKAVLERDSRASERR